MADSHQQETKTRVAGYPVAVSCKCELWAAARPQPMVYQSSTRYVQKWRETLEKPLQRLGRVTLCLLNLIIKTVDLYFLVYR